MVHSFPTRRSSDLESTGDLLVLQCVHRPGAGADEADVAAFADIREVGVFGEEAVAGVDGIDVGDFGGADQAVDAEVALLGGTFTNTDGFIGHLDVHGVGVGLGVDGDGADVELLARADDADGDFAAVSDQDFLEHGGS